MRLAWVSKQKPQLENACRLRSQLGAGERGNRLRAQICKFHKGGGAHLRRGFLNQDPQDHLDEDMERAPNESTADHLPLSTPFPGIHDQFVLSREM